MQSSEARTYEQAEVRKGRPQPRHLVLILLLLIAVALLACYIPGAPRDPRGSAWIRWTRCVTSDSGNFTAT
jgi:hypothetical protein